MMMMNEMGEVIIKHPPKSSRVFPRSEVSTTIWSWTFFSAAVNSGSLGLTSLAFSLGLVSLGFGASLGCWASFRISS